MGSEVSPGPDAIAWLLLLGEICAALLAVLKAVEKSLEETGNDKKLLRPYGGLIVPVGWAAWSIALICEYPGPGSVLIALMGVMAITIVGQRLVQNC